MKFRSYFALMGLASLPAVTFAATPTVTSLTGTVQTGQTLAISGSNLNNEATTNWDSFFVNHPTAWSFEGTSKQADGYSVIGPDGGSYDSTVSILGSKSIRFHIQGASTSNLGNYQATPWDGSDHWVRAYVRWNLTGGWPDGHIKMLMGTGRYFQPGGDINGNLPTRMIAVSTSNNSSFPIPSGQLENNRWYAMEVHWNTSTYEVWIDGQKVYTGPGDSVKDGFFAFGLINACCTKAGFALDNWFDGLVAASSRIYPSALVEVGNKPDYGTATKKTQALEKISDTNVQFKLNTAGLGSGPYYVWVTNNRQERSQAYALGNGNPEPILSPPKNLVIK